MVGSPPSIRHEQVNCILHQKVFLWLQIMLLKILHDGKISPHIINGAGKLISYPSLKTDEVNQQIILGSLYADAAGNESNGISDQILPFITQRIKIPSYTKTTESLNAAVATGIICAEFMSRV